MPRALISSLLAAVAIALLPAAALAQDAGGQQYTDPLAKHKTPTTAQRTPQQTAAPVQAPTRSTAPASPPAARSGLPRTGVDVAWLALAGLALVGGGFALRRVAERPGA